MEEWNKNIPKRRFKEFENAPAWEQRKLGEIGDTYSGGTPSVTNPEFYGGEIPFIRSGEISSNKTALFITEKGLQNSSAKMVVEGDILYALYGATSGEVSISNINGAINQAVLAIRMHNDNHYLISQWLKKQKEIITSTYLQGGQGNLSGTIIKNLIIPIPTDQDEQNEIGEFLKTMDQTITLHQRKLDKLKNLKESYLSEMFPAEGERKPKRRFAEFTDDWEQRELGEEALITMGQSPLSENYTNNPDNSILVQGNADMKNGYVFPRVWTTQVTKTAKAGDLILSVRAPVGDVGKTDYDVVLGRGVAGIKGNEFIFQLLGYMKVNGYWLKLSTGSTFESINSNDIKNAKVLVPNKNEQDKIGYFLSEIDKTITLHQRKGMYIYKRVRCKIKARGRVLCLLLKRIILNVCFRITLLKS